MSQEEKAKAYDELLAKAKQIYNKENDVLVLHTIEDLFPELKESKDERIRKELIRFHKSTVDIDGIRGDDIVSWLEKQGEQKPYGQREECLDCQDNYAGECKGSCELKRNEQKPQRIISAEAKEALYGKLAWSEEDEEMLVSIISDFAAAHKSSIGQDKWLKSLKERMKGE